MLLKYRNRRDAGQYLAEQLETLINQEDVIVLGLPRGGVPVADQVAKALHAPMDVFIVRKLGVPGHSELAMGAIAMGDVVVFNDDVINSMGISKEEFDRVVIKEEKELLRREESYRGDRPFPILQGKTIVLVDDGIATGASIRAAIKALKLMKPAKLIVAVPVAPKEVAEDFALMVDQFICPLQPLDFNAVGNWYEDFPQTDDTEVHAILNQTK